MRNPTGKLDFSPLSSPTMKPPPQVAPQGSQRGLMPLQRFGFAPTCAHLLQICCYGLLDRDHGMTGLVLPSGAARCPWDWRGKRMSLCGTLVSIRDRFFREVGLCWEGLQRLSLDAFWRPAAFPGRASRWTDDAEIMHERLHGGRDGTLRSQMRALLQDLGALPLWIGLEQRQDLLPDARERIRWEVQLVQDLLTARRRLLVVCPLSPFLGRKPRDGRTGRSGAVARYARRPPPQGADGPHTGEHMERSVSVRV